HLPSAPQIPQPAGRHGTQTKQEECSDAIGHQVFPTGKAKVESNSADSRRKDKEKQVIQCVRDIEQYRNWPRMIHRRSTARRFLCYSRHIKPTTILDSLRSFKLCHLLQDGRAKRHCLRRLDGSVEHKPPTDMMLHVARCW